MSKENLFNAVKILTDELKKDEDLRMGYRSNIAMAFVDECNGSPGFENVPYDALHTAANAAAERFLDILCSGPKNNFEEKTMDGEFRKYRRSNIAEMMTYVPGMVLSASVSMSEADIKNGSPKIGDMIARNPENHEDQWLVAGEYFLNNFERI